MRIPFGGPTYNGRSTNIDSSRCVNFYLESSPEQSQKGSVSLIGTPGTAAFSVALDAPIRMSHTVAGRCFVVAKDTLYEVRPDGSTSAPLGTFPTTTGRIPVADNGASAGGVGGDQMLMITGNFGYIYNLVSGTLTQITDPNFPVTPRQVTFTDGFFVVTDSSMRFGVSALYDGLTWPALAFAAAVSTSSGIQRPYALNQQLFLIKDYNTEVWYNAGISTTDGCPFAKTQGVSIDVGTSAPWSVARGANSLFFLANVRNEDAGEFVGVVMLSGYTWQVISTPAINYRISQFSTVSDAWGYCYADEGHTFYVLTFPLADATLVFDVTTGMWHERSYNSTDAYSIHRHLADTYTYFAGKHLVGHYQTGQLLEMSSNYYDDDGEPIISIRTAPTLYDPTELGNVVISKLIIDAETGVGGAVTPLNPQAWLAWSNDGGHTWSADYPASMGKIGEYRTRLVWRRLGISRNRVFRLKIADPVKKVILGAYINDGALPS